ncbi:MarR family transcriptional regulator [Brucella sp. MAB-22]|uniref:MarR family transcriptional regulator n=1 Tax=Brucella anthropi TaxID=529 RepID=A0A011SS55_BRUAN|nr:MULTISPECIES: MarR family transcriptional regulator [Brucella/Ochrobactrum group]QOD66063.1 MarR family transcriptional regulator [Ochrobactrum sp. MT180101]QTN04361.1 MarR family transcriptional regulator [Ochrobactrum sp. EEELCW01]EXL01974.1 transcriptional regulator [Brucella anthropi]KAB2731790.1 MarR family transcriptional regulator [Brucella anthropi]KAB2754902.1 MarR family transcriptional regulator [Brucella anthropi]
MISDAPRSQFGIRFSLLARRWRRALDIRLAQAGLTDATWVPLVHLHQTGGGLTQKELAALVGIDGSSLVRLLDILCRQGLAERRVDERDSRARLVHLTAQGEKRVAEIRQELAKGEQEMLADLSDNDIAIMLRSFDSIEHRLTLMQSDREQDRE